LRTNDDDPRLLNMSEIGGLGYRAAFVAPLCLAWWLTPLAMIVIGAFALTMLALRRPRPEPDLTRQEQARLAEILRRDGD
jgi:hypothetical protein